MHNYNDLTLFDFEIYEIYRTGYDPIENVKKFWDEYSLRTVQDYIITAFQPEINNEENMKSPEQMAVFSSHLFKTLIAYLMIHTYEMDLSKVSIPVGPSKEELEMFKRIYDFFQRVPPSNPNS